MLDFSNPWKITETNFDPNALGKVWYPPAVMISVLLTMLFMLFPGYRHAAKGTPAAK